MHIAIDARAYNWAGIGRYTRHLISGLLNNYPQHRYTLLMRKEDIVAWRQHPPLTPTKYRLKEVTGTYYSFSEQTKFLYQINQVRADLFHFTHFNVPVLFNRPCVVTIHDITRYIFPGQKNPSLLQQLAYEFVFNTAVRKAGAIIAVSNTTRNELLSLPIKIKTPISTIYEGIDHIAKTTITPNEHQRVRLLLGTQDPFLLYVGVWMSHKNLDRLITAFAQITKNHPQLKLVITSRPKPGYHHLLKKIQQLNLTDKIIFPGFVPDHIMPALYSQATCFVFPSLYEGFGLPALEAAQLGTQVITSNVSSLPEIMQSGAHYVNPEYTPDIVRAVNIIMKDEQYREKLITAGKIQADKFTWDKTVDQHVKVYENI